MDNASQKPASQASAAKERAAHVSDDIRFTVASQIRANRLARGWTQRQLAARSGVKQAQICRLENPTGPEPNMRTLARVGAALDIALIVRFVSFRSLAIPSFDQDTGVSE